MPTLSEAELWALLAGALDPGRAQRASELIAASPELQVRLSQLRQELDKASVQPAPRWRIPPPGIRSGRASFGLELRLETMLGAGPLQPGDRFVLLLDDVDDESRTVVVFFQEPTGWEVLFPLSQEEILLVRELPQDHDGRRRLELVARDQPGQQRWAVAQLDPEYALDWSLPAEERWREVRKGIVQGRVPVTSAVVEVGG